MERFSPAPVELRFSSLPQPPNKSDSDNSLHQWQVLPPREIIYQRTGNLATTTKLDQPKADRFMQISDMRRDIVIVDSDKPAEHEAVQVGKDTLAFETINNIRTLRRIRFREKTLYSLSVEGDQFEVKVHEKQIDQNVRATHYVDRDDYEKRFLELLNKAVSEGISQSLFQEKLGWYDQKDNYMRYLLYVSFLPYHILMPGIKSELVWAGGLFLGLNPIYSFIQAGFYKDRLMVESLLSNILGKKPFIPPNTQNRNWKEVWMPIVPVDKWIKGRVFLARHGQKLVIPSSKEE